MTEIHLKDAGCLPSGLRHMKAEYSISYFSRGEKHSAPVAEDGRFSAVFFVYFAFSPVSNMTTL